LFTGTEKMFNVEVLLDPLEKDLNLPAVTVNVCYFLSTEGKIVCNYGNDFSFTISGFNDS